MTLSEAFPRTETWELISASCTGTCQITVCKNYPFMTFLLILLIWVRSHKLEWPQGPGYKTDISETKRPSGIFSCSLLEVIVSYREIFIRKIYKPQWTWPQWREGSRKWWGLLWSGVLAWEQSPLSSRWGLLSGSISSVWHLAYLKSWENKSGFFFLSILCYVTGLPVG